MNPLVVEVVVAVLKIIEELVTKKTVNKLAVRRAGNLLFYRIAGYKFAI